MQRFIAIILLLCFGTLVPMQGMPLRWCKVENRILASGGCHCGGAKKVKQKCCSHCPVQKGEDENTEDCCVDLERLPELTVPGKSERIPAFDLLLAVLPLLDRVELFSPPVREAEASPPAVPDPVPIPGRKRQAVLSVWTV